MYYNLTFISEKDSILTYPPKLNGSIKETKHTGIQLNLFLFSINLIILISCSVIMAVFKKDIYSGIIFANKIPTDGFNKSH